MDLVLPKISIIVPVYNVENYVSKCIESIINQNYSNLEIIIVDDGSTDKSGDICDLYLKKDDRIILIHQENQGLSMARNNALDIASGDYIGFVDSDDWIAPDMYYTLYSNASAYDADISMCNFYYVNPGEKDSPFSNENTGIKVLENIYKVIHNVRMSNNFVWNKLYKHHLFNDIRFPKGKIFEDIFVMYKLIDNANKIVLSSQCKYYYLRRESSISLSSFNLKHLNNVEAYIERYNYISSRYPTLEITCRKQILKSFLWTMRKAYISNKAENYKEDIGQLADKVKCYDFLDCGLSIEEQNLLRLLFTDINSSMIRMNFIIQQNNIRKIIKTAGEPGKKVENI